MASKKAGASLMRQTKQQERQWKTRAAAHNAQAHKGFKREHKKEEERAREEGSNSQRCSYVVVVVAFTPT